LMEDDYGEEGQEETIAGHHKGEANHYMVCQYTMRKKELA
jgi:hypothetical protein